MGLLALLFLALWLGAHLARADEKPRPPPKSEKQQPKRESRRDDRNSPTPPGFPFGPAGGSLAPAGGGGNSGALNPQGFQVHP
jgi:hypothetical protein